MGLPRGTGTSPFNAALDGDRPWQNAVRGGAGGAAAPSLSPEREREARVSQ